MNNSDTIIPGVGIQPQQPVRPVMGVPAGQAFFPQSTVIPGVTPQQAQSPVSVKMSNGQVLGFLYSVSKSLAGEYWPIMLGQNTIGRGAANSIDLEEMTVSETHASIHAILRFEKLTVYIKDDQSRTGTLLNGELLHSEVDIKNGDIITIGEHYELYVILLNAKEIGLSVNPNFAPSVMPAGQPNVYGNNTFPAGAPTVQPKMGHATVVEGQYGPVPVGGHTVIMPGK